MSVASGFGELRNSRSIPARSYQRISQHSTPCSVIRLFGRTVIVSGRSVVRIGEYVKPITELRILPNGYKMFFASSREVLLINKDNEGVAGARADKIGFSENLIFGLITDRGSSSLNSVEKAIDTPGYFWLDSTTVEITKGLELGPWQDVLKAKGVDEPLLLASERVGPRL